MLVTPACDSFATLLDEYRPLLTTVPRWRVRYVAATVEQGVAARLVFDREWGQTGVVRATARRSALLEYFRIRRLYEDQAFAALDQKKLDALRDGPQAFSAPYVEAWYLRWQTLGEAAVPVIASAVSTSIADGDRDFETDVLTHSYARLEPVLGGSVRDFRRSVRSPVRALYGAPRDRQNTAEETDDGPVRLQFRQPWHDGTTDVVFDPVEFLGRLAVLIPRPRINVILYQGVLAPRATWRPAVVAGRTPPDGTGLDEPSASDDRVAAGTRHNARGYRWAELMRRTFGVDVLACPRCGGRLRLMALIAEASVIERILRHLGVSTAASHAASCPRAAGADAGPQPGRLG